MSSAPARFVLIASLLLTAVACSRDGKRSPRPTPTVQASASAPAPSASVAPSAAAAPKHAPGSIPFDFPVTKTRAKEGEFVLAPLERWVDEAFVMGGDRQTFIYYGARMAKVGERESTLVTLAGSSASIPNSLILPVGAGGSASPGEVVLTAWAAGSGLQRAIVVEGGEPTKPKVRYLDMDFASPAGFADKDDELPEGTFRVLRQPGELGTTVACKDGSRYVRWVVVASDGDKLLGLGFGGKMKALERAACSSLPIVPKLRPNQKVFVPVVGVFVEAKVTKVDAGVGRVVAKHAFGGTEKEETFSFTNVALAL